MGSRIWLVGARSEELSKQHGKLWQTSAWPLYLSPSHLLPCPPLTRDGPISLGAQEYKAATWPGTELLHMVADASQNWDLFQFPLCPGLSLSQRVRKTHHGGFTSTINQSWGTQDAS